MSTSIKLGTGSIELKAELNDSKSARHFLAILPKEIRMSRWGNEYYGACGIKEELSSDAKEIMEIGEMAIWPPGAAFCIFFGPTPASTDQKPRAASPVNPIGRIIDDITPLKNLPANISIKVSKA